MNLTDLMRRLVDGQVHHIHNTSGVINDEIVEVGVDRYGYYVKSAGRVKLYITRNGTNLNTEFN